jgi:hypothetical protein
MATQLQEMPDAGEFKGDPPSYFLNPRITAYDVVKPSHPYPVKLFVLQPDGFASETITLRHAVGNAYGK